MSIRKNNIIDVRKSDHLIKIYVNGNIHHEAQVPGYSVGIGLESENGGSQINYSPEMTLDDLKELRRVIRKVIRNESK